MKKSKKLLVAATLMIAVILLVAFKVREKPYESNNDGAVLTADWERA